MIALATKTEPEPNELHPPEIADNRNPSGREKNESETDFM